MQEKKSIMHNNCFDIIRHLAAILVIYSHHFALSGRDEPTFFGLGTLGYLSVAVFFSISGFLITQSFERRKSNVDYLKKRFFRIYPGLAVCMIFTIYLCAGIFGKMGLENWIFSVEPLQTFFRTMLITGVGVIGVTPADMNYFTTDYLLKDTMNGSLWTLFFEIFDYIAIALFLSLIRNKNRAIFLLLFMAIVIQIICIKLNITNLFIKNLSGLTIPFCAGALLFINKERWVNSRYLKAIMIAAAVLIFYVAQYSILVIYILCPIAVCVITITLGMSIKDRLIRGRFDFSYGIYIYAFPVQQIVINELSIGFYKSMILSIIITIVLAMTSWFAVEKRMIKR